MSYPIVNPMFDVDSLGLVRLSVPGVLPARRAHVLEVALGLLRGQATLVGFLSRIAALEAVLAAAVAAGVVVVGLLAHGDACRVAWVTYGVLRWVWEL